MIALDPRPGKTNCPLCRAALVDERSAECAGCQTVYHAACLEEFGRCATLGCEAVAAPALVDLKEAGASAPTRSFSPLDGILALALGGLTAFMCAGMLYDELHYSDAVYALVAVVLSVPIVPLSYGWIRLARRLAHEPGGIVLGVVERVLVGAWAFGQANVVVEMVGRSVDPRPGGTIGLFTGVWVGFLIVHGLARFLARPRAPRH